MTTTSLYNFNPAASDLMLAAFERVGLRGPELTAQHLATAFRESNLVQVELGNRLPNLFAKETYTQALTESTATYTLPCISGRMDHDHIGRRFNRSAYLPLLGF